MIRVVIADDHPIFLEGIAAVLATRLDTEVVGTARDGQRAIEVIGEVDPDVAILDIEMAPPDGIAVTRYLAEHHPGVRVVVLSASADHLDVITAIRAGADAYFTKYMSVDELGDRLPMIVEGTRMLSADVIDALFGAIRHDDLQRADGPELTSRETEVLTLASQGLTNQQIAAKLHVSPQTVKNHLARSYAKLGVHSRGEALLRARQHHLL